jgi:pantoate--beta-alanine ligase
LDVTADIAALRALVASARQRGCRVGCVPTMGALHAGHLSLVEECRRQADYVVVTIFVNPTQFGPEEDLERYPRPMEADLEACRQAGVHAVYMPEVTSLYPPGYDTWVSVDGLSAILEGEFRPTHFRGVTTIVLKLFHIVQPDVACFGAKDYQQQTMIRRMVEDLHLPVEIVVGPTIREPDGLALSSRNAYLSDTERRSALSLFQSLTMAEAALAEGETDMRAVERAMWELLRSAPGVEPQYAVVRDPETLAELDAPRPEMVALVAAKVGQTRLIDNRTIRLSPTGES